MRQRPKTGTRADLRLRLPLRLPLPAVRVWRDKWLTNRSANTARPYPATANNVSVEDHYKWLRLLEYHWLGRRPNGEPAGGQIAYTLKYNPRNVSYDEFMRLVAENQPTVRCCTFNVCSSDEELFAETQEMIANYGWSPETPLTREEYEQLMARIDQVAREDYDDSISCEAGVCAVDANINEN